MGTVATVTIGSDTFSVYGLTSDPVVDFVSYWNGQLGTIAAAVAAASSDNRKRALVMAAQWEDRAVSFSGAQTSGSQPRQWPRTGATCGSTAITDGTTPDNVARAEFELAGILLLDPTQAASTGTGSNVRSVKAGPAGVDFFTPTIGTQFDTRLPTVANDLLKCTYGSLTSIVNSATGTDVEDGFDEDDFERNRGFS